MDGASSNEGRVEYCGSRKVWGRVCDNEWDRLDARVVCRQLGYPSQCKSLYVLLIIRECMYICIPYPES